MLRDYCVLRPTVGTSPWSDSFPRRSNHPHSFPVERFYRFGLECARNVGLFRTKKENSADKQAIDSREGLWVFLVLFAFLSSSLLEKELTGWFCVPCTSLPTFYMINTRPRSYHLGGKDSGGIALGPLHCHTIMRFPVVDVLVCDTATRGSSEMMVSAIKHLTHKPLLLPTKERQGLVPVLLAARSFPCVCGGHPIQIIKAPHFRAGTKRPSPDPRFRMARRNEENINTYEGWVSQQRANREKHFRNGQGRAPVVLQNV